MNSKLILLLNEGLKIEDVAGCSYCNKNKQNCSVNDCANYHLQFIFYLKWYKWIKGMIEINNLDERDLAKLLDLNELEWKEFISGHVNPLYYKDYNYLDDLLYHMGCTTDDVNELNIKKKFMMKYRIKILSYIVIE